MKYKNKLNQVSDLLNKHLNLSIEIKLEQMKLDDGVTTVEAESFEPEYSIGIVTETGIVPMPVGEYTTADGTKITVEQEGVIATVTPANAEVETEVETEAPAAVTAPEMEQQQPKRVVESVSKETFFEVQEQLEAEKAKVVALQSELDELKTKLASQVEVELEEVKPLVHNPEAEQKVDLTLLATKKVETIQDRINRKLFSKN